MKALLLFCQVYHDDASVAKQDKETQGQQGQHGQSGKAAAMVASVEWRIVPMQRLLGYIILGLAGLLVCMVLVGAMRPTSATVVRLATPTISPIQHTAHTAPSQQQVPPATLGSFSVLSQPRLSPAFINQVLASYGSPAAGTGQALYDLGRQYGINSDFALAFFGHESTFGTSGEARQSLSLGNLRCIPNFACPDGYAWFPSWQAGYQAWYALIRTLYVGSWGLTTIEQIIPRYAPPSDHNDDSAYIADLKVFLTTWYEGKVRP